MNRSCAQTLRGQLRAASTCLMLMACGGAGATPETAATAEAATPTAGGEAMFVVADAAEWTSLLESGKAAFDGSCGACHPGGEGDLGPTLMNISFDSGKMHTQIREGSKRMRPVAEDRLPENDLKGLFVYLASLGAVSDVQQP
jgi:mono/diheme cytochrome c family protein